MTWGCRRYTKNFLRGVEKTPPRRRMQERGAADWRTFVSASIERLPVTADCT
ncbi:hypothetical protein AOR17_003106 [Salmonella enterica subsp. enterica serovar Javiana]|nr:hypothetical protein [Salmonella enterica subsp. enterica serovar Javiana]